MSKKNTIKILITTIVLAAVCQIVLFCHVSLYGEKVAYLEEAVRQEEDEHERLVLRLSQKANLDKLKAYAQKEDFIANPETLVLSSYDSFAYNW